MIKHSNHLFDRFGPRFETTLNQIQADFQGNAYVIPHSHRFAASVLYLQSIITPGMRILELGFSNLLHKYINNAGCWDYTTFHDGDCSPTITQGSLIIQNSLTIPATNIRINFEDENFPDDVGAYDLIICCEVIEHMDKDPMFLMSQLNLISKENAKLFITTPNAISSRIVFKVLAGYHPSFFMQYSRDRNPYKHNFEYTPNLLEVLLKASGYNQIKFETLDTFEDPFPQGIELIEKVGMSIENRGDNLFSISEKIGPISERYPNGIYS